MLRHLFEDVIWAFIQKFVPLPVLGAIIAFTVGLCLLGYGAYKRSRHRLVTRTPISPVIEVKAMRDGQVCAVAGRAVPGPAGVLTAPISGRPCVWWRDKVVHTLQSGQEVTTQETVSEEFLGITDQSGGIVAVRPPKEMDAERVVKDTVKGHNTPELAAMNVGRSRKQRVVRRVAEEWIVPAGSPLYALTKTAEHPTHGIMLDTPDLLAARDTQEFASRLLMRARLGLGIGAACTALGVVFLLL